MYWWDGTPTEKFKTPSSSSHNRLLEWCLQMCFIIFFPIVILCLFKRFSSIFCFFCRFQCMDGVYSLLSFFLSANWLFQISPLHKNIYSMLCVYPLKLLIKSFRWKSMTLLRLLIIIKDVSKGTFDLVRAGIFTLHLVFILLLLFHSFKKFFSSHYALTLLSHHDASLSIKQICFIYPFLLLHLHFSYKNERVARIDLFLLFNPRDLESGGKKKLLSIVWIWHLLK